MLKWIDWLDKQLFLVLNGWHSEFWDGPMVWISGKTSWIFMYVVILVWLAVLYRWRMMLVVVLIAVCVTLTDQLSVHLFKDVFQRLRPCHSPEIQHLVHLARDHCGGAYGFVSSHAANTFGVAMFTSSLIRRSAYTWFIFAWAALVSYSRIYLGVHYPGDILGGAMLGIGIGWFTWFLYRIFNHWISEQQTPFHNNASSG
jgi:undecaprenyl-diphosphatase